MSGSSPEPQRPSRRRRKFVRPDVQLKVVFVTLFVSCVTLVVQMRLGLTSLREISSSLTPDLTMYQVLDLVEASIVRSVYLAVVVALPLALGVGVFYSFKFAGPLYKFHKYFTELRHGRWDERCRLRRNDDLQDIAEAVDAALDETRDRVCEDQSILQDVKHLLTSAVFTTDESSRHLVGRLLRRIAASEEAFAVRFPAGAMGPAPVSDTSSREDADAADRVDDVSADDARREPAPEPDARDQAPSS